MKISKRIIIQYADNLIMINGKVSQIEIQKAIERSINRNLTRYEKSRITQVLRGRYVPVRIEIDSRTKRRVLEFK